MVVTSSNVITHVLKVLVKVLMMAINVMHMYSKEMEKMKLALENTLENGNTVAILMA